MPRTTTNTNTNTNTETVKSNAKLQSGQSAINAYDPVEIPYCPVLNSDGKHVPQNFNHDGKQWYPLGYDMNKHRVLKQSEFENDRLFYAYKSFVHIPWYMRKQQTRIDGWVEKMKPQTAENKLSSIVSKMMKSSGKTRDEIIELLKNM